MGLIKVGAAWVKEGKKGEYVSGIWEEEEAKKVNAPENGKRSFLMFNNDKKKSDTSPDYFIFLSDDE